MKTLLILRHAKSSWKEQGLTDHDRPLNKRGNRDAPRMGELVREKGLVPDLIISSTAVRARTTAEKVAQACGYDQEIQLEHELYLASSATYQQVLKGLPEGINTVMVVAHNPGLEALLASLTDEMVDMPTAALAEVSLPITSWTQLGSNTKGKLLNLWRPKELD